MSLRLSRSWTKSRESGVYGGFSSRSLSLPKEQIKMIFLVASQFQYRWNMIRWQACRYYLPSWISHNKIQTRRFPAVASMVGINCWDGHRSLRYLINDDDDVSNNFLILSQGPGIHQTEIVALIERRQVCRECQNILLFQSSTKFSLTFSLNVIY